MFARRVIPLALASLAACAVVAGGPLASAHPRRTHAIRQRKDERDHITAAPALNPACGLLESRFDRAIADRAGAPLAGDARMLRVEGGADCGNGDPVAGRQRLEQALRDIGEKPDITALQSN